MKKTSQTTQQNSTWLEEEMNNLQALQTPSGETLPSLKFETGKIIKFKIDFSNKFNTWTSTDGIIKAIIPVEHDGIRKNLWLNKKNPLYRQIIERGKDGQTEFAVLTIGTHKDTRYIIVNDDLKTQNATS